MLYSDKRYFLAWILALFGGFAYAAIPVTRLLIMLLFDYPYKSLLTHGALYVVASFFIFGLVGTLFTTGVFKALKRNY